MKPSLGVVLIIASQLVISHSPAEAFAKARKDLMVVAGDSISAGFLATTNAVESANSVGSNTLDEGAATALSGNASNDSAVETDKGLFSGVFDTSIRHNISILKLLLAQLLNHKPGYSWASGQRIESHYLKLQKALVTSEPGVRLVVKNYARSGAQTGDLHLQANDILRAWNTGAYGNIRYLTLMIGTNDACADWVQGGISDQVMEANLKLFFEKLSVIRQTAPLRVLLSSLPKVPDLGFPAVTETVTAGGHSCAHRMFEVDQYCNPLVKWATPEEYQANVAIIEQKNALLKRVAAEVMKNYPQFEVEFSEALYRRPIQVDRLAEDCFHPNETGQQEISDALWRDQSWWK